MYHRRIQAEVGRSRIRCLSQVIISLLRRLSWALEVITGCATVVGVSVQSTCSKCTGASCCRKSWGSSYKAWVTGIPYGCTPNLGCAMSKGRTHLTSLLLENWWYHMPHSRGHGNCILSCWPGAPATAAGAETQGTQDPYACGSKDTEEAVL